MSQHTMVISDRLYEQLTETARGYNLQTVEQLLEMWLQREEALRQRQQAVHQIKQLRQRLHHRYGKMADSVILVREDRAR